MICHGWALTLSEMVASGMYVTNYQVRMDTQAYVLYYPQVRVLKCLFNSGDGEFCKFKEGCLKEVDVHALSPWSYWDVAG